MAEWDDRDRRSEAPFVALERDRAVRTYEHDDERFDRLEFTARLLARVCPTRMRVAVYERYEELRVEVGRDFGRGEGARWAMLGVPPDASRRHIALAVAELAGVARVPFMIDWLVAGAAGSAESPARSDARA